MSEKNIIILTLKELKELGCPFNALYYKIIPMKLNDIYEVTFRYQGKVYRTEIWDCNLSDEEDDEEFECIEVTDFHFK